MDGRLRQRDELIVNKLHGETDSALFSCALLACIAEGRDPLPEELTCVAEKIRREAFILDDHQFADTVARGAFDRSHSLAEAISP